MTRPTAAEVREWSRVDFGSLGFADDADLQVLVDRSNALFEQITGRPLDATMPSSMEPLAQQAVQRMVEILAFQSTQEFIETLSDFQLIASFSAGSYSENRRSLTEVRDARMLTADPGLNTLLVGLLTPDQADFWLGWWTGKAGPGFEITEVEWMYGSGFDEPWAADPVTGATYGPWPL